MGILASFVVVSYAYEVGVAFSSGRIVRNGAIVSLVVRGRRARLK